ncbi:MAG: RnfABCDGE type electron transport complex subunit D [Treponema sp.]|nr:RnfABCDGE type electron transport complex subunit D [Treponema sp.]
MSEQKMILTHKPQLNISYPSSGRMWLISGCASLCVVQSSISDGGRTLIPVFTALFFALFIEYLLTWRNYGTAKIKDGSAAATALVLSILLPNQIPPVYAAFGAAFAIVVVKHSFGGLGSNWLNPALGGWLFIRFSWPAAFANALEKTASSITEMNVTSGLSAFDNHITDFLNNSIFSVAGVHLPSGYIDLLFYNGNSIIADRGLFFLLIGTIVITAAGINRGWIPLAFLAAYGFLVRFAADAAGQFWNGDLLYGIFSGGTIAAAFILAAEPASSAKLKSGILFTVILGAFLSWFFRYRCLEYSGCFIAVAIVNCFTPLVKYAEENFLLYRKNREKFQENAL